MVAAVILTGMGHEAFCSGGDQAVRDVGGYVGKDGVPRLNFLDLQVSQSSHLLHGEKREENVDPNLVFVGVTNVKVVRKCEK